MIPQSPGENLKPKPEDPRTERQEDGSEFWPSTFGYRLKVTDSLLVIFNALLFIVTGMLWRSTEKLWKAGERQIAVAEKAANAALAALDRPWLVIESANHNEYDWRHGNILIGTFRIHNYGKAPAFIPFDTLKAVVFASTAPDYFDKISDQNRIRFPDANNREDFIKRNGRSATISGTSEHSIGEMRKIVESTFYNSQIVLIPGESSEPLHFPIFDEMPGNSPSATPPAHPFMIGSFIYSMPGRKSEIIDFCYEGRPGGAFRQILGKPYNDRRQIQE